MVFHYLQIFLRNLRRLKGYSFINIFGLSAGLMVCMFILLYVRYEISFDSHHKDGERIYRLKVTVEGPTFADTKAGLSPIFAGLIKGKFPQVENVTWTWTHNVASQVEFGDKILKEDSDHVMFVDEEFLNVFTVKFRFGNPSTALRGPNCALITAETAKKYFGPKMALDQMITVDSVAYRITGVIEDPAGNSIFQQKIFNSWNVLEDPLGPSGQSAGFGGYHQTFVKLRPEVEPEPFVDSIRKMILERNREYLERSQVDVVVALEPLRNIHFQPDVQFDLPAAGNVMYLSLFAGIALFILMISTVNFMNLSTARSEDRAAEVGIRKTVGARRSQLMVQFMVESLMTVAMSFLIALTLVVLLVPQFNALTSSRLEYASLFQPDVLVGLMLLFVLEGVASGIYPACLLSSLKPVSVLKGAMKTGTRRGNLRRILVMAQFSAATILIVVAMVFNLQLRYMKHKPLGFEKEQMLIVDLQRHEYRYDPVSVKAEFLKHSSVLGAAFSSSLPGRWLYPWAIWPSGQRTTNTRSIRAMGVDEDFLTLYNIDLVAGEKFDALQRPRAWILSEKAIQAFGWSSAEEVLNMTMMDEWKVIGVMKDFHIMGLQSKIEPIGIFQTPLGSYLSLKIDTENIGETVKFVEQKYRSLFPGKYLEYFFLNDEFNRHYMKEEQQKDIFNVFTLLGMLIACLGLFALSAFMIRQKIKEIGIRKILGASAANIAYMLTIGFGKWVVISMTIAWPASYLIANKVLQNYAYRIDLEAWIFLVSALVAIGVALLTVGFQSLKAARADPVTCLREE